MSLLPSVPFLPASRSAGSKRQIASVGSPRIVAGGRRTGLGGRYPARRSTTSTSRHSPSRRPWRRCTPTSRKPQARRQRDARLVVGEQLSHQLPVALSAAPGGTGGLQQRAPESRAACAAVHVDHVLAHARVGERCWRRARPGRTRPRPRRPRPPGQAGGRRVRSSWPSRPASGGSRAEGGRALLDALVVDRGDRGGVSGDGGPDGQAASPSKIRLGGRAGRRGWAPGSST